MIYTTVFSGVALMLIYVCVGFGLTKWKKTLTDHAYTLSGLLIYGPNPCMVLNSFLNLEYAPGNFRNFMLFFAVSLIVQGLAFALIWLIFRKKFEDPRYKVLNIGAILANSGFFGLPIITAIFPDEPIVACYSIVYITAMNVLVFTVATFFLTGDKKYISLRSAILNPTMVPAILGVILYLLQIRLPDILTSAVSVLAAMATPLCMIVLGVRLASMSFREIFGQPFAYASSFLKLVVYPLFAYLCVCWMPFADDTFKLSMLVLAACPTAAVVLSIAEFHKCSQKLASNVILLSTILCIITLPVLCSIFI